MIYLSFIQWEKNLLWWIHYNDYITLLPFKYASEHDITLKRISRFFWFNIFYALFKDSVQFPNIIVAQLVIREEL